MTEYALTPATWTQIASAGSTVEVQNRSSYGAEIMMSASQPSAGAQGGEVLFGSDIYRKYDAPLAENLWATSTFGTVVLDVEPIGSGAGGGSSGSVAIGQTSTAGDASITTGGTAQTLFGGATPSDGFFVANPDPSETLWISDSTTAAPNGQGSIGVPAGAVYETPPAYKPAGAVSVYGATTGHKITARRW